MSLPSSTSTQTVSADNKLSSQAAPSQSEMPRYARSTSTLNRQEVHRRSQLYARITYGMIIILFVSVCAFAVMMSMQAERNRQGFRPITVKKPISFVDYTYVRNGSKTGLKPGLNEGHETGKPAAATSPQQP